MDILKKMKSYASNPRSKASSPASNGMATLSGSEISKLGTTGKYSRIPSSVAISGTNQILEKRSGDLVYIVYFILGTGFLLPWNAFITAVDYFGYLYPNTHVDRIFSVSYLVPCLAILCLLIAYGQRFGPQARINCGLGLFFISIVVVPIMEALFIIGQDASSWTYFVTVGAVVVAGVGDALVQGTLIGFAGHLPERYTQAIVSGTGFSGVLVSLLRIVTKYAFPDTPSGLRSSANIYFTVSAVFVVFCTLSYNAVYGVACKMVCKTESEEEGEEVAVVKGLTIESELDFNEETTAEDGLNYGADDEIRNSSHGQADHHSPAAMTLEKGKHLVNQKFRLKQIFLQVSWLAAAMAITYVITLAIFPGFLTEDVTSAALGDWYPVLLIGCYNVFDLVGKSFPAKYVPSKQVHGFGWAAARLLFFPLYSACVHGPKFFRTETPVFVLTGLLGLTNGYLTTCLFLVAPRGFKSGSLDVQTAGVVMVLALEVGLTVGSLVGWVWVV
ncbi:unnamed protein product [Calypogeia fissa]